MDELIAFMNARLDEDEAAAKALQGATRFVDRKPDFYGTGGPAAEVFWERFTEIRALREVAAKRAHLAAYEDAVNGALEWGITTVLENILYSDAAVWSDHPDYQPEWGR